jgi:ribosome-binding factor A
LKSRVANGDGEFVIRRLHVKPMKSQSGPSQRQLRAGELIRHALADVFLRGEVADPALEAIGVSVLEVAMSPDLRTATAYVRPIAPEPERKDDLLRLLERHHRYIRGLITPRVEMRYMPDLRFRIDTALDYAEKIDRILSDPVVARDLGEKKQDE